MEPVSRAGRLTVPSRPFTLKRFCHFLFLFWFFWCAPALGIKRCYEALEFTPSDTFLLKEIESLTMGELESYHHGSFADLKTLLRKSEVEPHLVERIMANIHRLLSSDLHFNSILNQTVQTLLAHKNNQKTLEICVLHGDCQLMFGPLLHLPSQQMLKIRPSHIKQEFRLAPWIDNSSEAAIKNLSLNTPHRFIIDGGPRLSLSSFIFRFIREATHFADYELLYRWAESQRQYRSQGHHPKLDPLFDEYVKVQEDGSMTIDEGFVRIFLEARAFFSEVALFETSFSPAQYAQLEKNQRRLLMKELGRSSESVEEALVRFQLNKNNIFEFGEKLGLDMLRNSL